MSSDHKNCPKQPPIIDLSKKRSGPPGTSSWIQECEKVRRALEDYGWFVATYDDLTSELHDDVFKSLEELFELPLETKQLNTSDIPYHGYLGNQSRFPVYESLGIEEAHEMTQARAFTSLMWPNGNPKFCESINAYSKLVTKMDSIVQSMVFESYGVERYLESSIASTIYNCRLMKYRVPKEGEPNLAALAHTDKSFFTILHQNEVKGLVVQTKDGQWIDIDPFPSSFVVMAGEGSKAWSNGRIYNAVHKVMSAERDRYSIGLFSFNKGMIKVPEELIDDQNPLQYKPFRHLGLLQYFANNVWDSTENTIGDYCSLK